MVLLFICCGVEGVSKCGIEVSVNRRDNERYNSAVSAFGCGEHTERFDGRSIHIAIIFAKSTMV